MSVVIRANVRSEGWGGRGEKGDRTAESHHSSLKAAWPHVGEGNGTASAARRFRRPHASRRAAPHRKTALGARPAARGRAARKDWHSAGMYYVAARNLFCNALQRFPRPSPRQRRARPRARLGRRRSAMVTPVEVGGGGGDAPEAPPPMRVRARAGVRGRGRAMQAAAGRAPVRGGNRGVALRDASSRLPTLCAPRARARERARARVG